MLCAAHGKDPGATAVMRNLANKTKGRFYIVTNPKALPANLSEGSPVDLAALDIRASNALAAQAELPRHRARDGPSRAASRDQRTGADLGQGERAGRDPDRLAVAHRSVEPGARSLDLRTGSIRRLHLRRRRALGENLARLAELHRLLVANDPLVDAPADRGNLTLNVRREQGRIKVVVDALDKNNEFLNFLQIRGNTVDPNLKSGPIELVQTAPGRYEGTIENAESSGNYFISLGYRGADNVQGVISSGVSVPYSDEYRELRSNPTTLEIARVGDRRQGCGVEADARRPYRPAAHRARQRPLPPRRGLDQSPHRSRRCGRRSCGWPPAFSWATSPFAGSRSTSERSWRRSPRSGRRSPGARSPPRAITWTSFAPARPKSANSSTAPRHPAARAGSADSCRQKTSSGPIGEPLLEGGEDAGSASRPAEPPARPGMAAGPATPEKQSYTNRLLKAKQRVWEEREKEKDAESQRKDRPE